MNKLLDAKSLEALDWARQYGVGMVLLRVGSELKLNNKKLKEIPELIGQFKNLKFIDLRNNQLTCLPEGITQLTQLLEIDLDNNILNNLPEQIKHLNLEVLSLSNNQLNNLPDWIGNLTQLKKLNLRYNELTSLPESIGKLKNLEELTLANNELTSLPDSLRRLDKLKYLDLKNNQIENLPEYIGELENLNELNLLENKLTYIPESLCKLIKQKEDKLLVNIEKLYFKNMVYQHEGYVSQILMLNPTYFLNNTDYEEKSLHHQSIKDFTETNPESYLTLKQNIKEYLDYCLNINYEINYEMAIKVFTVITGQETTDVYNKILDAYISMPDKRELLTKLYKATIKNIKKYIDERNEPELENLKKMCNMPTDNGLEVIL